jgi:CheY-like chemotaxis protein
MDKRKRRKFRTSAQEIAKGKRVRKDRTILVVEDDNIDAEAIERAFMEIDAQYSIVRVTHGEDALTWLRDPKNNNIGIILLDLNLPIMNGIEFLQTIKADNKLRRIPVVVVTTSHLEEDKLVSYHLSVAGYMVKPVDTSQFLKIITAIEQYWSVSEIL